MSSDSPGETTRTEPSTEAAGAAATASPASRPEPGAALAMRALRDFYYGGVAGPAAPQGTWLPLSLARYRGAKGLRSGYPLLLWFEEHDLGDARAGVARTDGALSEALDRAEAQGAGEMRLLRDNIVRLEQLLVQRDGQADVALRDAREEIAAAGAALRAKLSLRAEHDASMAEQLDALCAALPEGAVLLGETQHATVLALSWLARGVTWRRRRALRARAEQLIEQLRELVWIDESKTSSLSDPQTLAGTLGKTAGAFDPTALAGMLSRVRGAPPMQAERRKRIENVVEQLSELRVDGEAQPRCLLVTELAEAALPPAIEGVEVVHAKDVPTRVAELFDERAKQFAPVVAALRVARLELDGRYSDARHQSWLTSLDWRGFSDRELALLPAVVGLCDERSLERGDGLSSLSALLRSQRPVRLLVRCQSMPEAPSSADGETARPSLASFGVSQRVGLVHQCAVSHPEQMIAGLERAARSERASLHLLAEVAGAAGDAQLPATVVSGAQVAGRAHPLLIYDPQGGPSWARRVDFLGNPDPGQAWPSEHAGGDNGAQTHEGVFTFADLALLSPAWRERMALVDDTAFGTGVPRDLMALDAFVEAPLSDRAGAVPFIWGVDEEGRRARLVIPRALALLAVDQQGHWRWLQELAGVRSEYVNMAVAQAVAQAEARAADERARLVAEHDAALEDAQRNAASQAMQRLAEALTGVGGDLAAVLGGLGSVGQAPARVTGAAAPAPSVPAKAADAAAPAEAAAETPAAAEDDDDDMSFDEPWIDSMLCTTCNDCTNLNPLLFAYNENKQAYIKDPKAGTFGQLVTAAEACPARCIHPGKPLDPNEAGLDELIERAKPFN